MTRAERIAAQLERNKAKLAETRRAVEVSRGLQREEAKKTTNKWRYHVGALADEAGLRTWSTLDSRPSLRH